MVIWTKRFFCACNNGVHGVSKGVRQVGEGIICQFITTGTCGRNREDYKESQVTSNMNHQKITILLPTRLDYHSHGILCDDTVERTARWKCNISE